MIECVPERSEALEHVACPDAIGTLLQIVVAPSLKVTVPAGVLTVPDTVAVNVTACPPFAGLSEEVNAIPGATGAGGTAASKTRNADRALPATCLSGERSAVAIADGKRAHFCLTPVTCAAEP